MRKKYVGAGLAPALLVICLLTMLTLIMTACASSTTSASGTTPTSSGNNSNTVLLEDATFNPSSITIKKGESITLVNHDEVPHIIHNGTLDRDGIIRDNPDPTNAPKMDVEMQHQDEKQPFGPLNTAGTFYLYCTIHSGMILTIIVK